MFNHKGLVDDLYKLSGDLYHAEGIQDSKMLWWRDGLARKYVVCDLDKRKQDVSICCFVLWQQEFKRWFDGQDVETVYPDIKSVEKSEFQDDVNEKITNMKPNLLYTVAHKDFSMFSRVGSA